MRRHGESKKFGTGVRSREERNNLLLIFLFPLSPCLRATFACLLKGNGKDCYAGYENSSMGALENILRVGEHLRKVGEQNRANAQFCEHFKINVPCDTQYFTYLKYTSGYKFSNGNG